MESTLGSDNGLILWTIALCSEALVCWTGRLLLVSFAAMWRETLLEIMSTVLELTGAFPRGFVRGSRAMSQEFLRVRGETVAPASFRFLRFHDPTSLSINKKDFFVATSLSRMIAIPSGRLSVTPIHPFGAKKKRQARRHHARPWSLFGYDKDCSS